jgi:hypothetical protein
MPYKNQEKQKQAMRLIHERAHTKEKLEKLKAKTEIDLALGFFNFLRNLQENEYTTEAILGTIELLPLRIAVQEGKRITNSSDDIPPVTDFTFFRNLCDDYETQINHVATLIPPENQKYLKFLDRHRKLVQDGKKTLDFIRKNPVE